MNHSEHTQYCRLHFRQVAELALEIGEIMLTNGAETQRVEDTICRLLNTTGFSRAEAYVSLTGIILGLDDPSLPSGLTLVRRISRRSNDLGRIAAANDLSRQFVEGSLTVEEALSRSRRIRDQVSYSPWLSLLYLPIIAAAFTFMFAGHPRDAAAAALMGFLVALLRLGLLRLHLTQQLRDFLCAAFLGLTTLAFTLWLPLGQHLQPVLAGSIMILVPGLSLTVSFRDLIHGDYISGIARVVESFITALCVAAGVSLVLRFWEGFSGPLLFAEPEPWLLWGRSWPLPFYIWFEALCSFLASVFFCILFGTERRYLGWCGVAGAVCWFVYRTVEFLLGPSLFCYFAAALVASALAYPLAHRCRAPVTIFFTAGIFCLVPGYRIYQTMFYFLGNDLQNGISALFSTLGIAVLIAVAMALHSSLREALREARRRS